MSRSGREVRVRHFVVHILTQSQSPSPQSPARMAKATYKDSGVDLDVYAESMARLPRLLRRTHSPRVLPAEGGFAGLFQLDFTGGLFARQYQGSGAGLRDGRRRHEAESRPAGRRAPYGRHRPGGDVRQRRAVLRRGAAVLPRLRGDGKDDPQLLEADRARHQRRLRGERHGAHRRRDGHHARHVPAGRLRPGRVLRRRGRAAKGAGRLDDFAGRHGARRRVERAALERLSAWCGRLCSKSRGLDVGDFMSKPL